MGISTSCKLWVDCYMECNNADGAVELERHVQWPGVPMVGQCFTGPLKNRATTFVVQSVTYDMPEYDEHKQVTGPHELLVIMRDIRLERQCMHGDRCDQATFLDMLADFLEDGWCLRNGCRARWTEHKSTSEHFTDGVRRPRG